MNVVVKVIILASEGERVVSFENNYSVSCEKLVKFLEELSNGQCDLDAN
jgi:hypothetical protein